MSGSGKTSSERVDVGIITAPIDCPAAIDAATINAAEVADARHECANCSTRLTGSFCNACGQRAHVHRSLLHVGEEILHGITHFDGKAWQTLPMLLFRPGALTRDYIMGQRARYIAPVPLFLLVVFLMFFVFSFIKIGTGGGGATDGDGKPLTQAQAIKELPAIEAELRDLDRQIAAARARGETTELPGLRGGRAGVAAALDAVRARARGEIDNVTDLPGAIAGEMGAAGTSSDLKINLGSATLDAKVRKALKNPELVLYKIQGKAYKLSFLLVPLSLPWLWLMFAWKRDVRIYDHAVFALYSISFMSLLFIVGSVAAVLGVAAGAFWLALFVVAPVAHMFVQLKGAYALSNRSAAWRTAALTVFAGVTLVLFAMLMIVIGVLD